MTTATSIQSNPAPSTADRRLLLCRLGTLSLLLIAVGGCVSARSAGPARPPQPLLPDLSDGAANLAELTENCFAGNALNGAAGPVYDIVLTYVPQARTWRDDDAPDGYLLRIFSFDKHARPVPHNADATVALFAGSPTVDALQDTPQRIWRVPAEDFGRYWIRTPVLDCFNLPLDWGPQPVEPGHYFLLARLTYPNNTAVCTHLEFDDYVERTSEPLIQPLVMSSRKGHD